ncbi:radial spoke head 14 [Anaeramoeba ignava]|uniref:Radial spoke head 14 n=1 Tax=Anaeramoeba ignava TaxID=1746090 RepID=A0A9Q0R7T6_ANAIG|nr:radial spoke head 14 [Anaeramoeba ignava]
MNYLWKITSKVKSNKKVVVASGVAIGIVGYFSYKYFSQQNQIMEIERITKIFQNEKESFQQNSKEIKLLFESIKNLNDSIPNELIQEIISTFSPLITFENFKTDEEACYFLFEILQIFCSKIDSVKEIKWDDYILSISKNMDFFIQQKQTEPKIADYEDYIAKGIKILAEIVRITQKRENVELILKNTQKETFYKLFSGNQVQISIEISKLMTWMSEYNGEVIKELTDEKFLVKLIEFLSSENEELLANICSLLRDIVLNNPKTIPIIMKNNTVNILKKLLNSKSIEVKCDSSLALSTIMKKCDLETSEFDADPNLLSIILNNFFSEKESAKKSSLIYSGLELIYSLALQSNKNKESIRENQFFPYILRCLEIRNQRINKLTIRTIKMLTTNSKVTHNVDEFLNLNLLEIFTAIIPEIKDDEILSDIEAIIGDVAFLSEENRRKIQQIGLFDFLLQNLFSKNPSVQSKSVCAIANCLLSMDLQLELLKNNLLPQIIELLNSDEPNSRLGAMLSVRHLAVLGSDPPTQIWAENASILSDLHILTAFVRLQEKEPKFQQWILESIFHLSKHPKFQQEIQKYTSTFKV